MDCREQSVGWAESCYVRGSGGDVARRTTHGLIVACALVAATLSSVGRVAGEELSRSERDRIMRRAQVWLPPATDVADLGRNPGGDDGFADDATVECRFQPAGVGGSTPKFECVLADGDEVKVKYGRDNPEVYSEVIASRLLASLGFPTDRMYTVARVRCLGCPDDPFKALQCLNDGTPAACFPAIDYARATVFEDVVIERPVEGRRIETARDRGWTWEELTAIDPAAGGASRAHVDALRLMAVYLGHWDNKAKNQRLLCLDDRKAGPCDRPLAMVQDLGDAFGPFKLDLDGWRKLPVWKDAASCLVSMRSLPYEGSTFPDRTISEAGRAFLAERLRGVTRAHLRSLVEGARLDRYQPSKGHASSLDDWADAMYAKVRLIVDRAPCAPVTVGTTGRRPTRP